MQPLSPLYPPMDVANLPTNLDPLPIINRGDSYWKRLKTFLFARPKFNVQDDYFTYIDELGAWMWCPINFVYDFASIPKVIPLINPAGVLAYPALPHDFIYRFGGLFVAHKEGEPYQWLEIDRKLGDKIFYTQAKKANGLGVLNTMSTASLRVAGGFNFKPRNVFEEDWSKPVYSA